MINQLAKKNFFSMTAILSMPNIKSENACKWEWINRMGKKHILKINTKKQSWEFLLLSYLKIILLHFSKSQNLKLDEQSVIKWP